MTTPYYVGKHVLLKQFARMYSVDVKVKQNEAVRFNYRKDDGLLLVLSQGPWLSDKAALPSGVTGLDDVWLSVIVPDFGDQPLSTHIDNVLAVAAT